MVRHIVMFEFAKEAEGKTTIENAVIAKDQLLELKEKLDFIRHMEVGINDSDADDTNYTLCLTCDFDSFDDLNRYAVHPEHLKVAAFIGTVKVSRACVDYEL
ncbi:Dabb family protein [Anaerosporobacter sp.]